MRSTTTLVLMTVIGGCDGGQAYDHGALGLDPLGDEVALSFEWTINGGVADEASCAAAGIDRVGAILFAESDSLYEDGFLVASAVCADGAYHSGKRILAAGAYRVSVEALDVDGAAVGQEDREHAATAPRGGELALGGVDFVTLTTLAVGVAWDAEAPGCDAAEVERFGFVLRGERGEVIESESDLPCEEALYFEEITPGTFTLELQAYDAEGALVREAACTGLAVQRGAYAEHECTALAGAS